MGRWTFEPSEPITTGSGRCEDSYAPQHSSTRRTAAELPAAAAAAQNRSEERSEAVFPTLPQYQPPHKSGKPAFSSDRRIRFESEDVYYEDEDVT